MSRLSSCWFNSSLDAHKDLEDLESLLEVWIFARKLLVCCGDHLPSREDWTGVRGEVCLVLKISRWETPDPGVIILPEGAALWTRGWRLFRGNTSGGEIWSVLSEIRDQKQISYLYIPTRYGSISSAVQMVMMGSHIYRSNIRKNTTHTKAESSTELWYE